MAAVTQQITDSVVKNNKTATAPPAVLPATPTVAAAPTAPPAVLPATPTVATAPSVAQNNFKNTSATGVAAATTKPSTAYVTDNALIEKRLEALLAKDNPLLKQAQLQSQQAMNASGVANSSMANQLGTQAVLSKGLEIVAPDANTYATSDLARQATDNQGVLAQQATTNQGALANQAANIEHQATNQQGNITAALNRQQQQYTLDQSKFNAAIASASAQQQATIQAAQNRQQQQYTLDQSRFNAAIASASAQQQATIQAAQKEAEMRFNESIQQLNLNAEKMQAVSGVYATASASYITNVSEIMNNPDLDKTAKDALIAQLRNNFYTHMGNMATLAGVNMTFK